MQYREKSKHEGVRRSAVSEKGFRVDPVKKILRTGI